ncbi:hypothetical protein BB560_003453 [Smittium megazygosporum]|uniref:Trafficking protein particle complex subunit n=1 Tax=Smittium megazygosporum TaxID=133381 RepID=A0A2T9ZBX8_9FUNG|nr:hypothetical protein BB560_003453 [Smittium megazygosporum]
MIYNLYFYNRYCECIFYAEWDVPPQSNSTGKPEPREKQSATPVKSEAERKSSTSFSLSRKTNSIDQPSAPVSVRSSRLDSVSKNSSYSVSRALHRRTLYRASGVPASPISSLSKPENRPPSRSLISSSAHKSSIASERSAIQSSTAFEPYEKSQNDFFSFIDAWKLDHSSSDDPLLEESKLVYGAVFSIRNIINKLRGFDGPTGKNLGQFYSYKTKNYKCHYFESLSGIKIVINTDPNASSLQNALQYIYSRIYVEHIVKNPMSDLKSRNQRFESNDSFKSELNSYVQSLPMFAS